LCRERGYPCTAEHKVLAPSHHTTKRHFASGPGSLQSTFAISRAPPIPDDLILIDIETDSGYREFYELTYSRPTRYEDEWIVIRILDRSVSVHAVDALFECPQISPLVISAQLAFASHARHGLCTTTLQYLASFYRLARSALLTADLLNLAHASYLVALLSLVSGDSPASIQAHMLQFGRVINTLFEDGRGISEEYLVDIELMWNRLTGYLLFLRRPLSDGRTAPNFEDENSCVLQQSCSLVSRDITNSTFSCSNEFFLLVRSQTILTVFSAQLFSFVLECKRSPHCAPTELSIAAFTTCAACAMEQIYRLSFMVHGASDLIRKATSFGRSTQLIDGPTYEELDACDIAPGATTFPSYKWRIAFFYCFISMIRAITYPLVNFSDISTSDVNGWSFSLCYLCKMRVACRQNQTVLFLLFWAAIVLAKRFPQGISPHIICDD